MSGEKVLKGTIMSDGQDCLQIVRGATAPHRRGLHARRKWIYRLILLTVIPTLFFCGLELVLYAVGFGYPVRFFLKTEIAHKRAYVENLDFGRPFFSAGLERAPLPLVVKAEKVPSAYRIFVFGESAAMGFPGSSFSFARILEVMLQDRFPKREFEVTNTSMTAINSHVILPIAQECAHHQPDLFVVYMGNNEVVGPFGASGVLGPPSASLRLLRASLRAKRTRIGQALVRLNPMPSPATTPSSEWNGMTMFVDHQVRGDDSRLPSVYDHFRQNLADICDAGTAVGAQVVICTVPTNLRDLPPFGSLHSPQLSSSRAREWEALYEDGIGCEFAQDYVGAVEHFNEAARIDDHRADLQFRLARCLLAIDQTAAARKHFVLSRDRDTLRFRADSEINAQIRSVAAKQASAGIHLVDVEREFEIESEHQVPGNEFFYEHVHLNFSGNYIVACAVFNQIDGLLTAEVDQKREERITPLSEVECKSRLAFTEWNELNSLGAVAQLYASAPFTTQIDIDQQQFRVRQEIERIQRRFATEGLQEPVSAYRWALNRSKTDFVLHMDYGLLLMSLGRYKEAADHFFVVQRHLPYHPAPHVLLAHAFEAQGKRSNALHYCSEAIRLRPGWPQAMGIQDRIQHSAGKSKPNGAGSEDF